MKALIILILTGFIQMNGFSQIDSQSIRVSGDIELIKLSDHAYVHVSYTTLPGFGRFASNGLILVSGREAFLFDTPVTDSLTMRLVSWLKDVMKLKVVGFVPNHWHNDCMGGLRFLQDQKIELYANQTTIDMARSRNLPVPAHGFKDSLLLQLGELQIKCYYMGAAHSLDNIVVWIPSEQILFPGCMVKSLNSSDLGNTADGDLIAYPETIEKVIRKFPDAKIVIPGHGQFGGLDLIRHTSELTKLIK